MAGFEARKIWVAQCEAAVRIRERFGLQSAFDYLVLEKLMDFAEAASTRPDFAHELPAFVAEVRRLFTTDELHAEFARSAVAASLSALGNDMEDSEGEEPDPFAESPETIAKRVQRSERLKELLLAGVLGIS